ncbi:MAG: hypothetical protein EOP82_03730 [Variovorax sp.]|nr:MAG: hypothetical protein EOP82_03730 [Variovorax sp.]
MGKISVPWQRSPRKRWTTCRRRADQVDQFAKEVVGVHPRVIFQMMKALSVRVPGLLDTALLKDS